MQSFMENYLQLWVKFFMTEQQNKIIEVLKNATIEGMTLPEISTAIGEKINSGTINVLTYGRILKVVSKKKVNNVMLETYALMD